jgi:hypothetical protein
MANPTAAVLRLPRTCARFVASDFMQLLRDIASWPARLLVFLRAEPAFLLLLVFAALMRFYHLGSYPRNLGCDECDNLRQAWEIVKVGKPSLFELDWKPQPALSQHMAALCVRHLGLEVDPYLQRLSASKSPEETEAIYQEWHDAAAHLDDVFALRFNPALISVLVLIPFYLLMRRTLARPAALFGVLLLAVNPTYMNFSRSGWENVHIALASLMAIAGIMRTVEGRGSWLANVILTALGTAWGLYGYFSGRAIPVFLALSFVVVFSTYPLYRLAGRSGVWGQRAIWWSLIWILVAGPLFVGLPVQIAFYKLSLISRIVMGIGITIALYAITLLFSSSFARGIWTGAEQPRPLRVVTAYIVGALLAIALFLPQIPVVLQNYDLFSYRMRAVSALSVKMPHEGYTNRWELIGDGTWKTLRSPFLPINNTRRYSPPGEPLVGKVTQVFLAIGLVVGLVQFGRHLWWWLILIVPFVSTQVMTTQAPHTARGLALFVPMLYFAALGVHFFWRAVQSLGKRFTPVIWVGWIAVACAAFSGMNQEYRTYREWMDHPTTLHDRGPAVDFNDYPDWMQFQYLQIAKGLHTQNNDLWEEQKFGFKQTENRRLAQLPDVQPGGPQAPPPTEAPRPTAPPGIDQAQIHNMLSVYTENNPAVLADPDATVFNGTPGKSVYLRYYQTPQWQGSITHQGWTTDLKLRAVPQRQVGLEWLATLTIPAVGEYEFALLTDDGGDATLGGRLLLSDLTPHAGRTTTNRVMLLAGPLPLRLRMFQRDGAYGMVFFWHPPGGQWGPIPAEALSAPPH